MWFVYSLLCAVSLSVSDLFSKIVLGKADIYIVSWIKVVFPFLILSFLLTTIQIPSMSSRFWIISLFLFPMEVFAVFLYMKAIQVSPLSLTLPFLSLTPLFLILTSYFMLGEKLDFSGFIGIFLIVAGSYMLNLKHTPSGIFSPVKAVFREKGSWLMIIVAALYSFTSNLGKMAIQETDPLFFAIFYSGVTQLLILPFPLFFSSRPIRQIRDQILLFLIIGAGMTFMILFHVLAIVRIQVPYMISIKRTSPIFSVLFGHIFLHEVDFWERFTGSIVMFTGVVFILL